MDSLWAPRISSYEAIHSLSSQNIFLYLKMFSMQCRKIITAEDNKKSMNITNLINVYKNVNIYIICGKNDSK